MLTLAPHLALAVAVGAGFLLLLVHGERLVSPAPAPALTGPPRRWEPGTVIEGMGVSPAPPMSSSARVNPTVIDAGPAPLDVAALEPWPDPPALPPAQPTTGEQAVLDGWLLAAPTEEAA